MLAKLTRINALANGSVFGSLDGRFSYCSSMERSSGWYGATFEDKARALRRATFSDYPETRDGADEQKVEGPVKG